MNNYVATLETEFAFREMESCFCLDPFSFRISKEPAQTALNQLKC